MSDAYIFESAGRWRKFAADVSDSKTYHSRERLFKELLQGVSKGEMLVMKCEIAGTNNPCIATVPDFAIFCWLMDRLDAPWDSLVSMLPIVGEVGMSENAG